MVTQFLNFCLGCVSASVSMYWLFAPILVLGLFCLVFRLVKRRYD